MRPRPLRDAAELWRSSRVPAAVIGVILDWVKGTPQGSARLAQFDGHALGMRTRAREHGLGQLILNYGVTRSGTPSRERALLAAETTLDGRGGRGRVDAYLDTRASRASGAEQFGGRENSSDRLLRQLQYAEHEEQSRLMTVRRVHIPGRVEAVHLCGGSASQQWNIGVNKTPRVRPQDPVHRSWGHHHLTFALLYAFSENFSCAPRRGGEEVDVQQGTGDPWQKAANLPACTASCTPSGKKLMFMGCGSAAAGMEPHFDATGTCSTALHKGAAVREGTSSRDRRSGAHELDSSHRDPVDRLYDNENTSARSSARADRQPISGCDRELHPVPARRIPVGVRRAAVSGAVTATAKHTAAAMSATPAWYTESRSPTRACRLAHGSNSAARLPLSESLITDHYKIPILGSWSGS